ncbi:formin-binding protein 4 isoform X2 [Cynara cardunculus var. scolymus]|uniref:formin-binding protein 4 isoform X2 n=1 Tax=Cynara cardunculus var. scolymus TaxID=59895 RepID=UPI000D62A41F|nr:formin-binding protein 4 isoform X2 [Cynara cardunculus var. scolymus]
MLGHPIHHLLQVGSIKFLPGLIFVEGVIVLVDVYFIQDMFALPRYSFQTVRWLWYWELNWSTELVQLSHSVSLIEIPDMLYPFFRHAELRHFNKISGQKPENPLLLLGQYSDEELEEESGKEISHDTGENSPAEPDEQLKADSCEGTGGDKDENLIADKDDQENKEHSSSLDVLTKLEENGVIEDNTSVSLHIDTDAVDQTSVPWTSDQQATGDLVSGWKMVLHEESNSYYYWNIATGETSWEVPAVLAQGNEPVDDPKSALEVEEMHVTSVDTHIPDRTLEAEMDVSVATQLNNGSPNTMVLEDGEIDGSSPQLEVHDEKYAGIMANDKDEGNHVDTIDGRKMSSPDGANYGSSHRGFARYSNHSFSNGEAHGTDSDIQDMKDHINQGRVADSSSDSLRLLQLGENLLERLRSLKGSEGFSEQISKLMFELDIRLVDIKSLVPYGSSLLPFWLHAEDHLKKLEAAVNNQVQKCLQPSNIAEMNEAANRLQENVCEAPANEKKAASASLEFDASDHASLSKDTEKVLRGASSVCTENPYLFVDSTPRGETVEDHGNVVSADISPNLEDVDMDVEMEVEDALPSKDETGVHNRVQSDQSIPSNPPSEPLGFEEFEVPPPPNDEWIPPPPPDDEPLPPPPPDEPHEVSFPPPPSEMQTAQPYSYGEQYNFTYPGSSFDYYGQTNTVPSNDYYVDANGCQVAAPLATLYYATVPHPYPDPTSVVNPAEPVTYYTLQEGSVPTAPAIRSVETSLHKSGHENITNEQTESITAWNDRPFSSSQVEVTAAVDRQIGKPSAEIPSISSSTHVPATSAVTHDVSVLSASAVSATVTSTEPVPKAQPKVSRKKRTVATVTTLRSNKKVSGLVDKWKAVKEELHEDEEDEPENAYEVLEKKRQREIEQWHAQQIATGEARDNANFQPLGGDWRERVRRKRAKKSIEAEENKAKAVDDTNRQPDLVELSKQLPSGWQAYWDEASKQVYYGNSTTSETTWTKPTN